MDSSHSDFGMLPKVAAITDRITEQENEVVVNRNRDGQDVTIHIPLDGSSQNNDILGNAMNTSGHWEGSTLIVDFSGQRRGNTVTYKERWTLSPDSKTFQVARHLTSSRGETNQTLLMVKQ